MNNILANKQLMPSNYLSLCFKLNMAFFIIFEMWQIHLPVIISESFILPILRSDALYYLQCDSHSKLINIIFNTLLQTYIYTNHKNYVDYHLQYFRYLFTQQFIYSSLEEKFSHHRQKQIFDSYNITFKYFFFKVIDLLNV